MQCGSLNPKPLYDRQVLCFSCIFCPECGLLNVSSKYFVQSSDPAIKRETGDLAWWHTPCTLPKKKFKWRKTVQKQWKSNPLLHPQILRAVQGVGRVPIITVCPGTPGSATVSPEAQGGRLGEEKLGCSEGQKDRTS